MKRFPLYLFLLSALALAGCGGDSADDGGGPAADRLALRAVTIGDRSGLSDFDDVAPDAAIVLDFTAALDASTVGANIYLLDAGGAKVAAADRYDGAERVTLKPSAVLNSYADYRLIVNSGLRSAAGEPILTGKVSASARGWTRTTSSRRSPTRSCSTRCSNRPSVTSGRVPNL